MVELTHMLWLGCRMPRQLDSLLMCTCSHAEEKMPQLRLMKCSMASQVACSAWCGLTLRPIQVLVAHGLDMTLQAIVPSSLNSLTQSRLRERLQASMPRSTCGKPSSEAEVPVLLWPVNNFGMLTTTTTHHSPILPHSAAGQNQQSSNTKETQPSVVPVSTGTTTHDLSNQSFLINGHIFNLKPITISYNVRQFCPIDNFASIFNIRHAIQQ